MDSNGNKATFPRQSFARVPNPVRKPLCSVLSVFHSHIQSHAYSQSLSFKRNWLQMPVPSRISTSVKIYYWNQKFAWFWNIPQSFLFDKQFLNYIVSLGNKLRILRLQNIADLERFKNSLLLPVSHWILLQKISFKIFST